MAICDASTLLDELVKTFEFADVSYGETRFRESNASR